MKTVRKIINWPVVIFNWLQLRRFTLLLAKFPTIRGRLTIGGRGTLKVGENVIINSSHRSNPVGSKDRTSIHIAHGAKISIGNNVGISNSLLYAWESITIEDNVMIGGGCQIYDTDFHSIQYEDRICNGDNNVKVAPVLIKKGAFIGTSSIIMKGVTIGERSVIAAGAVVVKDVPADEVWGGNPARCVKSLL